MNKGQKRLCRICLVPESDIKYHDFFEKDQTTALDLYYLANISIVELKELDQPALICRGCKESLSKAVILRRKAVWADQYYCSRTRSEEEQRIFNKYEIEVDQETLLFTYPEVKIETDTNEEWFNEDTSLLNIIIDKEEEKLILAEESSQLFNDNESAEGKLNEDFKKKKNSKKKKKGEAIRRWTKGGYKLGICSICNKNLHSIERLNLHVKTIHEQIPLSEYLSCPFDNCEKKFKVQFYLERHIDKIHNPNYKNKKQKHPCPTCGVLLSSIDALGQHELRHVPHFSFFCDLCGFGTKMKLRVRYHIERVHLGIKKYKCKYCDEAFTHSAKRLIHVNRVHLNVKKYECRFNCGKQFYRSSCRLIHERIHSGERPYKCRWCERTFIHHSDYRRHELRHTGGIPVKDFLEKLKHGLVSVIYLN